MSLSLFWQDHPLNDSAFVLSLAFDTCYPSGATSVVSLTHSHTSHLSCHLLGPKHSEIRGQLA